MVRIKVTHYPNDAVLTVRSLARAAIDLIQEATPIRTTADRIALLLQTVRAIQARRAFDWQAQLRLGFGSQFQCLFAFNYSSLPQKKSFDPEFCGEPLGRLTRSQDQDAKPNSPARLTPRINRSTRILQTHVRISVSLGEILPTI